MPPATVRDLVFVSYSHANPEWRDKLLVLLKPFVRQGQLQVWADPYLRTGDVWRRNIDEALARTCVGVVLLTPDLLASDFIADVELPYLLRAARAGHITLVVVPIEAHVAGSTRFADGDLEDFQWPWTPEKPIAELEAPRRHRALATVVQAIVDCAGGSVQPANTGIGHERTSLEPVLTTSGRLGVLHGVPKLPPHYISRGEEHDGLRRAVLGDAVVVGVSATGLVGVHGQGGLGKSVLAISIAHDEDVRRAFPDGIFWIAVGQQPYIESLQAELAERFGERTSFEHVGAGARALQQRLAGKACLLILDDVWELVHAKAFDVLDVRSRLLVTTRDRSIVTALGARDMRLDVLAPAAAVDLLARWAGTSVDALPSIARDVANELDYLPLGLALAGAQIRDGQSWADLHSALRAGRLDFLHHPYGSVFSSIKASVDALAPADAARYAELAVFPEDVPVPVSVVETLWRATSGVEERDARALLSRLASRSLLSLAQAITMHDLQHDYVRLVASNVVHIHGRLVDAWRAMVDPKGESPRTPGDVWATLPASSEYPWHYLTYHLDQAGRHDELEQVLTSAAWLFERLTRFNLSSVLADFRPAIRHAALRDVRDALVLSAHVLSTDPRALMGHLRGRLLGTRHASVERLIESPPLDRARHSWFRPLIRCLAAPGGPLLQTFEGHTDEVTVVAVLPDGQRALSGSGDRTLKLWDLTSGAVLQTFEGHGKRVTTVALLPDRQRALFGSDDGTLKLWDLTSGAALRTFDVHTDNVTAVTVLPDEQRAVSCGDDGWLKVWDFMSGEVVQAFRVHTRRGTPARVLPDGQRALYVDWDNRLGLWDLTSDAVVRIFEGHTDRVSEVTVFQDGQRALSAGHDHTLKLWDLTSGTVLQTFAGHTDRVVTATLLPDADRALSGSDDGTLKLWDLTSAAVLRTFEGHAHGVTAVTILPDGKRALSADRKGTLKLWDLTASAEPVERHTKRVDMVMVLPDGQRAVSGSHDRTLKMWNLASGAVLETFEVQTGGVTAMTVLPDGRRVLSCSEDGPPTLWDLGSGKILHSFETPCFGRVTAVTVLPDGRRALSGDPHGHLTLWDLASDEVVQSFRAHTMLVNALTVLPDGRRALSTSWDCSVTLSDLVSGVVIQTFNNDSVTTALTILPDARRVLSGSHNGTVQLWELTSGAVLQTFDGHSQWVSAVTVLPDGHRAISGSFDRTLKLWNLTSGEQLAKFYGDAPFTALSGRADDGVVAFDALGRLHVHTVEIV